MDNKKEGKFFNRPISSSNDRFDELAIAAEARRLQSLRDQDLRDQQRLYASHLRYPTTTSDSRPRANSLLGSSLYNDPLSRHDLDVALRLSSSAAARQASIAPIATRPNPFDRHSFLPHGPSYMNALTGIPPNEALVSRPSPSRAAASLMPAAASMPATTTRDESRFNNKRRRDFTTLDPSLPEYKEQDIVVPTLPPRKRHKHRASYFPLPPLHESSPSEKRPCNIPLTSYSLLWESLDGNHETFRTYICKNRVPIKVDSSITGRYS